MSDSAQPQGFDMDDDDIPYYDGPKWELIERFRAGDLGEVEFFELALAAGISPARIGKELEIAREDF